MSKGKTILLEVPDIKLTGLSSLSLSLPLSLSEEQISKTASFLEDEVVSVSWVKSKSTWNIQWVFQSLAPIKELIAFVSKETGIKINFKDCIVKDIPETNWLEESYKQFPPFEIEDFFVFGSHYLSKAPKGKIPLQIDAATAFGSGEHGTTRGCLEALLYLKTLQFKPKSILDMGAGSGILGIAAYKLWRKPVLAVDIDKEATRVACHHRKINDIPSGSHGLTCTTGDGYKARRVVIEKNGFNLIIANILAGPLISMAPQLSDCLSSNGFAILSGLLKNQEKEVLKAHQLAGLTLDKSIRHGDWVTMIMRK